MARAPKRQSRGNVGKDLAIALAGHYIIYTEPDGEATYRLLSDCIDLAIDSDAEELQLIFLDELTKTVPFSAIATNPRWYRCGGSEFANVKAGGESGAVTFGQVNGKPTFTIPEGIEPQRFQFKGGAGDLSGNDLTVVLAYQGTRIFNQNIITALCPGAVQVVNAAAGFSTSSPNMAAAGLQWGISAVGASSIEITIKNVGTLYSNYLLIITI